jgi:lysophospholipase L1-like esterase
MRLIPRALILAAPTVIVLIALEMAVRYFSPVAESVLELDQRYLFKNKPGARAVFRHPWVDGGRWINVEINENGFRGKRSSFDQHAKKIVVYGDSYVAAEYSKDEDTFVARLEEHLNLARSPGQLPVQVLNAGVTGYGPDQIALRMEDELPRLRPDLVVVTIFAGNDFGDLLRNKIFRLDAEGRIVLNHHTLDPSAIREFDTTRRSRFHLVRLVTLAYDRVRHRLLRAWGPQPSATDSAKDDVDRMIEARRHEYVDYVIRGNNSVSNLLGDDYDADMSISPDSESSRYRIQVMAGVIQRLRDTAEAHGSRLLILIVPSILDACPHYDAVAVDPKRHPGYERARLTGILEQLARQSGVPEVNLFARLQTDRCSDLFYVDPDDGHWNSRGQERAARITSKFILGTGLL